MQAKLDADANTAEKTLELFQKLMLDGRRHYQSDLTEYQNCSKQTVMRLIMAIERGAGSCLALYALGASVQEESDEMRFIMSLAIHHIKDVSLTNHTWNFKIPGEVLGLFGLPRHEPRTFRIRFQAGKVAEYVRERVWYEKQKFSKQEDGSLILEMMSCSEPEVEAGGRSFGEQARLIEAENQP